MENFIIRLNDLKHGFIFLNDGTIKPVSEFEDIKLVKGVAEIDRENLKQMFDVTARLNNRDLGSTLSDIQKSIQERDQAASWLRNSLWRFLCRAAKSFRRFNDNTHT